MNRLYTSREQTEAGRVEADWGSITWLAGKRVGNCKSMTLGRVIIKKGESNPRHCHNNCEEILHLLSGSLAHTIGDETVHLQAGDTLVAAAGLMHNAVNVGEEDADMIIVYSTGERDFQKEPP